MSDREEFDRDRAEALLVHRGCNRILVERALDDYEEGRDVRSEDRIVVPEPTPEEREAERLRCAAEMRTWAERIDQLICTAPRCTNYGSQASRTLRNAVGPCHFDGCDGTMVFLDTLRERAADHDALARSHRSIRRALQRVCPDVSDKTPAARLANRLEQLGDEVLALRDENERLERALVAALREGE